MDVRRTGWALAMAAGLVRAASAVAPVVPDHAGIYEKWFRNRLELGTRFSRVELLHADRWDVRTKHGFVGTICHLEEEQTIMPYNLTAAYFPGPHWGGVLRWEQMETLAVTHSTDHHVDGTYRARGPALLLAGRWPLGRGWVPYAELGFHAPTVDFAGADWWRQGYETAAEYDAGDGSAKHGHVRRMDTRAEDPVGLAAGVGLGWRFGERWMLDAGVRYVGVEGRSHHYSIDENGHVNDHGTQTVPLSYLAAGAGAAFRF